METAREIYFVKLVAGSTEKKMKKWLQMGADGSVQT